MVAIHCIVCNSTGASGFRRNDGMGTFRSNLRLGMGIRNVVRICRLKGPSPRNPRRHCARSGTSKSRALWAFQGFRAHHAVIVADAHEAAFLDDGSSRVLRGLGAYHGALVADAHGAEGASVHGVLERPLVAQLQQEPGFLERGGILQPGPTCQEWLQRERWGWRPGPGLPEQLS